jgi:hypothetical protein
MEHDVKKTLPYRREAYRLWFEYLRVALRSSNQKVREVLKRSAPYYAPWGDISNVKFDQWWKDKAHLFEEEYAVRRLGHGEKPTDRSNLLLEIPLSQPRTKVIKQIRELVREASSLQKKSRTRKNRPTSQYRLTRGAEPRLLALREMLTVYRAVYLKNRGLRGVKLLEKVHEYYLGRKNKYRAKVPQPLIPDKYDDRTVALRNMRRYITKAERVMLNVANGEFPGTY